ncbi:efflux RND transporter periplasmic adaptor subunit [Reyranella sp. CPCC 100927]|uniref:efflux RND transporter periplasmic adaptor subunit n=1 Tax=Reyranella sp. CPCC 100927 TaxID=2599616 RepID=UPI0011B44B43|nr:efflux RND transporter periplasmic adaptor subunit [Reyranella sp. CPCC 100927]TWT03078.1 efflux RND transporter periplasmic adaptor subunit [Reyranella sp. CPCC 100927]
MKKAWALSRAPWAGPLGVVTLAMVFAVAGCERKQQDQQGGGPPPVTVAKPVVKEIVEMDEFTGRFEPVGAVEVRARVGGYLESVHFKEGAVVKEGDLLFVIDRRPFKAVLDQAESSLVAAQTRFDLAKVELERAERLAKSGAGTEQSLDQRRQGYLSAQADLAGAKASLEQSRLNYEFTEIRAPITGRISRKLITEGNLINANTTLLTTIVSIDPIYFYFDIDERSYLAYQRLAQQGSNSTGNGGSTGLPVMVMLTDEKEYSHKGTLDFTDNRLDAATGTMRLRASFPNKDLFLTSGLFGRIAVPGSPKYKGVMVPDEAILTDLDRRFVYVVAADGSVKQQPLRLGSRTDNYRIVRDGLKGDETVVINGLQRVRMGGGKVTPQPVELPPVWKGLMALGPPPGAGGPPGGDKPGGDKKPDDSKK